MQFHLLFSAYALFFFAFGIKRDSKFLVLNKRHKFRRGGATKNILIILLSLGVGGGG